MLEQALGVYYATYGIIGIVLGVVLSFIVLVSIVNVGKQVKAGDNGLKALRSTAIAVTCVAALPLLVPIGVNVVQSLQKPAGKITDNIKTQIEQIDVKGGKK
ncbi:hypothetical protein [Thermoactinomyces sp. DSM 45892]|uniref:hypothetical protein n=1 Tax=Thermoactinomyces sp. DSM 45892 TaxID=1882753 RepID=UPI00089B0DD2|nr:hypothetical protein [Thermoactinomyces sp. DSM 45892]SDY85236.1 hypothetical protein SAMN05444416_10975 [Thermoactinomyces sp. DSM 45892]